MEILYTQQKLDCISSSNKQSIFLAGPTPRVNTIHSWRPEIIKYLNELNFDGFIIYPEYSNGKYDNKIDIQQQIEWEEKGLTESTVILFWIPRDMDTMPGLTTNDEWGTWKRSGKVVLGTPRSAFNVRYQVYYAKKLNIPYAQTLLETTKNAIKLANERKGF